MEKEHADDEEFVKFAKFTPTAPIHSGLDGGMNRVFLAQVGGNIPPARVPPPSALPPQPEPVTAIADNGQPSLASKIFGVFAPAPTQVAATETVTADRGATGSTSAPKAKPTPHHETETAAAKPKSSETREAAKHEPKNEAKSEPQQAAAPKPKAGVQEASTAPTPAPTMMSGAQPTVASGNFDNRWGGLQ
jgi:hypothetical protein